MSVLTMLTDRPDDATALVPHAWQPITWRPSGRLDTGISTLWGLLSDGARAWQCDAPPWARTSGPWPLVFVIGAPRRSPFDRLREQCSTGGRLAGSLVCVSLEGTTLHGHRGRAWAAAAGNLHLSLTVPVGFAARTHAPAMSMLPAVAAIDALRAVSDDALRPGIKWVNDIVIGDRKVGGVLAATQVRGALIESAVLGIGLNVAVTPGITPTPFVPASGCLRQCAGGSHLTAGTVMWSVLEALATRLRRLEVEGPGALHRDYQRWSVVVGRRARIWDEGAAEGTDVGKWPAPTVAGLVVGIGPDLSLAVEGRSHAIREGRLAFEEVCQAFGL